MRTPRFPCLLEPDGRGQLLVPKILAYLLERFGFHVLGADIQKNEFGTVVLIARKN